MNRKLLEQVLKAMQHGPWTLKTKDEYNQAIDAIRAELDKPKPDPVAEWAATNSPAAKEIGKEME
jgi:hypothetical protein